MYILDQQPNIRGVVGNGICLNHEFACVGRFGALQMRDGKVAIIY